MSSLPLMSRRLATRPLLRAAILLLLLSSTVLERFGINAGPLSASLALPVMYVFLVVAGLSGALALAPGRAALYCICLAIAVVSLLYNEGEASPASLLLLTAMYLPFVFVLRPRALATHDAAWVLRQFIDLASACAVIGVLQFALQFVVHADWLFDYTRFIPEPLRATGTFNTVISIGSLNKSNGFFFREPSGFSYLAALGLVAELTTLKRPWRVACLGAALLLTYSGTGILALLIASSYPLGAKTLLRLLLVLGAGALVFLLLGDSLQLSFTLGRVSELSSDNSSGYMRYVAPARLLSETFGTSLGTVLIGHGPGTIFRTLRPYEFHDPTWAKLLFEYGLSGFVGFLLLFGSLFRNSEVPSQLRAALFWGWLIMGGHLLSAEQNFLTLALVGYLPGLASRASNQRARSAPPDADSTLLAPA